MINVPKNHSNSKGLFKFAIFVWIVILFLSGTYIRHRPGDVEPEVDWLVLAQISVCLFGAVVGIALMHKTIHWGKGAKLLLLYLIVTGFSVAVSSYPTSVLGYWILLSGVGLLTMGLVKRSHTDKDLKLLENAWFVTISLILLKDMILAVQHLNMSMDSETTRLGMGVTHAVGMSFLAGLAFWISLRTRTKNHILLWILRLVFLFIIAASKTRISLIGFILAGLFFMVFAMRRYSFRWILVSCSFVSIFIICVLCLSFDLSWAISTFGNLNRGQDITEITSLTGRTEIWPYVINKIFHGPIRFLFGHGYGISRLALNEGADAPPFYAYHCHNAFLEHFFGMGFFGLILFVLIVVYGIGWLIRFNKNIQYFQPDFIAHAGCVVIMFLVSFATEAQVGNKINPAMILYLFYILALDKKIDYTAKEIELSSYNRT